MIEARKISKEYVLGKVTLQVLKGVSLKVEDGAFIAVSGPSGAGKSTLLHLLAGLDTPTRGEVLWNGDPVSGMSDAKRAAFRNQTLGIVFQFYHLLPELTALENVILPGQVGRRVGLKALRVLAERCLEQVGLQARLRHKPKELSGGEQQRVAIARALVNEPAWLLCDEPTGNLDSKTGAEILAEFQRLNRDLGLTIALVTHDPSVALQAARVVTLKDGLIESDVNHEVRPQAQALQGVGTKA